MEKPFSIQQDDKSLTIDLNPRNPAIIKFGLGCMVIVYGFFIYFFLSLPLNSDKPVSFAAIILVLVFVIPILFFTRALIRKMTQTEIITVDATHLVLVDKYLLGKKTTRFELQHIKQIVPADSEKFTPHPLEGNYGDIGFRGREGLIRTLIEGGRISIEYGSRKILFGRNVPSWDTEEIVAAIERFSGRTFTPKARVEAEPETTKFRGKMS